MARRAKAAASPDDLFLKRTRRIVRPEHLAYGEGYGEEDCRHLKPALRRRIVGERGERTRVR